MRDKNKVYMNFLIDLAHRGVSVAQWYNIRARRFDSSWELKIFSLSQARDKTKKKHLSLFFYRAQNLPSLFLSTKKISSLD